MISKDNINLVVMGRFGSGKSRLVNVLLGEEILPERALPTTALITEIYYGEKKKVVMYPKRGKWKGGNAPFEIEANRNEIYKYCTLDNSVGMNKKEGWRVDSCFEKMVVYWPLELLKDGVSIVDSPGINVPYSNNYIEEEYVLKADAILYCINALQAYSGVDKLTLEHLNASGFKSPIIVTTYFDVLISGQTKQNIDEYIGTTRKQYYCRHTVLGEKGCHYVDSQQGLEGKLKGSQAALVESGYFELEKFLGTYLSENKGKEKICDVCRCKFDVQVGEKMNSKDNINIVVMGRFGSGKSTLINVLLGEKILLEFALPTTAIITEIYYGEKKKVVMYPKRGKWKGGNAPFEIEANRNEISKYCTIGNSVGMYEKEGCIESCFEKMVVYWPSEVLKEGLSITDTPGDTDQIPDNKDIVIYCMNPFIDIGTSQNTHRMHEIQRLFPSREILIAITSVDTIYQCDGDEKDINYLNFIIQVEKYYKSLNIDPQNIFYLDSKKGIKAKLENDNLAFVESGYYNFERALIKKIEMIKEVYKLNDEFLWVKEELKKAEDCVKQAQTQLRNQNLRKDYEDDIDIFCTNLLMTNLDDFDASTKFDFFKSNSSIQQLIKEIKNEFEKRVYKVTEFCISNLANKQVEELFSSATPSIDTYYVIMESIKKVLQIQPLKANEIMKMDKDLICELKNEVLEYLPSSQRISIRIGVMVMGGARNQIAPRNDIKRIILESFHTNFNIDYFKIKIKVALHQHIADIERKFQDVVTDDLFQIINGLPVYAG